MLQDTNLWLKDFAQMHSSSGVRAAIQSLAGIYIYDYLPLQSIRNRVNQRFMDAEKRFTQLLQDPNTSQNEAQSNELLTIAIILSMQDVRSPGSPTSFLRVYMAQALIFRNHFPQPLNANKGQIDCAYRKTPEAAIHSPVA